ncbi:hypothetical protein GGTG_06687 [Gaeumannomyces tritici R3-111a-1]|uniref:Uncharacterized protein n=1 Tax=Gaeumannomyces tritici (strain R3-111a-1) TaxID=644352 RepID=J3NZI9_GAET3|nr:hypothetical protein GGTG_06687 [Gaeumannomyces tritici R3-111a-1]EJT76772.1 hypothetical protein GGTG_06687 [Gaeumannomyces tritici R3-111a-1]
MKARRTRRHHPATAGRDGKRRVSDLLGQGRRVGQVGNAQQKTDGGPSYQLRPHGACLRPFQDPSLVSMRSIILLPRLNVKGKGFPTSVAWQNEFENTRTQAVGLKGNQPRHDPLTLFIINIFIGVHTGPEESFNGLETKAKKLKFHMQEPGIICLSIHGGNGDFWQGRYHV